MSKNIIQPNNEPSLEEEKNTFGEIIKKAKFGELGLDQSNIPFVIANGYLKQFDNLPVYNLNNGQRVFRFKDMTKALRGTDTGHFSSYLAAQNIIPYLPEKLVPTSHKEGRKARGTTAFEFDGKPIEGYDAEDFIDICIAFTSLYDNSKELSEAQQEIVRRAQQFIRATAKVGITALIDEATGYQYTRAPDALSLKLQFFLADDLQKWEKTFPDQFWMQLGRLTDWKGSLSSRPKYWGKLVNEFIYFYLDKDLAQWLKDNVPPKLTGKKYHQWLNENVKARHLIGHINQVIGLAMTCATINELRLKMRENFSADFGNPLF
jgi:P63C domain